MPFQANQATSWSEIQKASYLKGQWHYQCHRGQRKHRKGSVVESYLGVSPEGELECIKKSAAETTVLGKEGKPACP